MTAQAVGWKAGGPRTASVHGRVAPDLLSWPRRPTFQGPCLQPLSIKLFPNRSILHSLSVLQVEYEMAMLHQFCCLDFFHILNICDAEYNLRPYSVL